MELLINDHKKIFLIQEEFNTIFPYLKLDFFSTPHYVGEATSKKSMMPGCKTLGECRTVHNDGKVCITPYMTVADLEQRFQNTFGLSVQVMRKSGKVWLETTVTDGWTLEKQNEQGEALSRK